jgi:hypothetical protein
MRQVLPRGMCTEEYFGKLIACFKRTLTNRPYDMVQVILRLRICTLSHV